jgi:concentrative nucleoside transporter, CNT family
MERFIGLIGVTLILGLAFLASNNKRKINLRLVLSGLALQIVIAVLVLKIPPVTRFFQLMGSGMETIEQSAKYGANFVYGGMATTARFRDSKGDSSIAVQVLHDSGLSPKESVASFVAIRTNLDSIQKLPTASLQALKQAGLNDTLLANGRNGLQAKLAELSKVRSDSASLATLFEGKNASAVVALISAQSRFDLTTNDYSAPGVFVFAINITATIILVCVLVAILYHIGLMQRIVQVIAKGMNFVMRVSGSEALSNVASAFVGQIEAQVMIRPYLATMTKSELLASMTGSLACIAGGIMVVYVGFGAKAEHLIAASLMAAPGALVISKIVFPETEQSQTMGKVQLSIKKEHVNLIDAIGHGAGDGWKISMNVIAMLIGFMALIYLINVLFGLIHPDLTVDRIFSWVFYPFSWAMGIPAEDMSNASTLLGQKLAVNEFVAFRNMTAAQGSPDALPMFTEKGKMITSIAICGFANFSSVGMQIGGIGALAPERRADLAKLGLKALFCGTLASYLSASIAGILF